MTEEGKAVPTEANDAEVEDMEDTTTTDGDCDDDTQQQNTKNQLLTAKFLNNDTLAAAFQNRLGALVGSPSGYIASLPTCVKRRLKALKQLQLSSVKIEANFYEEVHELEMKYAALYTPLFQKRKLVVNGDYEPVDAECEWPSDDEEDGETIGDGDSEKKALLPPPPSDAEKGDDAESKKLSEDLKKKASITDDPNVKGVPDFWLTIMKNVEMLQELVQEQDEPALHHLQDITIDFHKGDVESEPMGFTLVFHFAPNDFFTNATLTKRYMMKCEPEKNDPFSFEGPEIVKCRGCIIDWKKGKNLCVKLVKKKQKHKGHGAVRTVTKTVQNESFFNFFNPPQVPEGDDAEVDEETQNILADDFEVGHFIREQIVPRAVLYFTGEALDDDDDDEYEDGEDEDDEEGGDDDEDEEEDDDYQPPSNKQPRGRQSKQKGNNPALAPNATAANQECKQQ